MFIGQFRFFRSKYKLIKRKNNSPVAKFPKSPMAGRGIYGFVKPGRICLSFLIFSPNSGKGIALSRFCILECQPNFVYVSKPKSMKTSANNKMRTSLLLSLMLLFCLTSLFSQQVIKFKSGKIYEVKLLSQSADTVKYEMLSAPGVVFTVSMDQVEKIWTQNRPSREKLNLTDSVYLRKKISQYNSMTVVGVVLGLSGAALIGVGASIKTKTDTENHLFGSWEEAGSKSVKTLVIVAGSLVTLAGITISIVNGNKAQKYNEKLKGLSVDIKSSAAMTGITVRYRF
jgi:hypothetical protein